MKNCKKHLIVALIVLTIGQFLAPIAMRAQVMEVGGSVGLAYYMGDVNPRKPFNQSDLGFGAIVRYYEGTRWAFRFSYSYLRLKGSDKASGYRPERGLSFNTDVHDFALITEFNFFDYFTGSKRNRLSPYLFAGISVFHYNPKADDGTELHGELTDVVYALDEKDEMYQKQVEYSLNTVSIPFGIGAKYSVSRRIGLALEWRWDLTFTDYLDDCHGYYPTYSAAPIVDETGQIIGYVLQNGIQYSDPTGFTAEEDPYNPGLTLNDKTYIQRGNKDDFDWFGYLNISMTYKFNLPHGKGCNRRERYKNFD